MDLSPIFNIKDKKGNEMAKKVVVDPVALEYARNNAVNSKERKVFDGSQFIVKGEYKGGPKNKILTFTISTQISVKPPPAQQTFFHQP